MRKVADTDNFNAKEFLLYEDLADYKRRTAINKTNQHKNAPSIQPYLSYYIFANQTDLSRTKSIPCQYQVNTNSIPSQYQVRILTKY